MEESIKEVINGNPDLFYGFADLSGLLPSEFNGYDYAIVLGRKLDKNIIDGIVNGPNITYWNHYREVNDQLYTLQLNLSKIMESKGISSQVIPPTLTDEHIDTHYNDTLRVEFSHKMAATQAGLGWIGKTALFVSSKFGPRVRLATLLTNVPLKSSGTPISKSECGDCILCVDKCPAGAATGEPWNTRLDRDEFFDAFKCRAMCRQVGHKMIGKNKRLCGICVAVCPVGR
jgi:epoxyqueuosine reductase